VGKIINKLSQGQIMQNLSQKLKKLLLKINKKNLHKETFASNSVGKEEW
jgi:hypothetical protein